MSFASSAPKINYTPGGFRSGGLNAAWNGSGYKLSETPALKTAVGQVASTFGQQASELGNLRSTVAPGFSLFRQAGLADIANQGQANISNLRDTLAQRRILGSSFANSSLSQAQAELEKQRTDFIAKSYLEEISASNQLIQEQYTAATNQFKVGLDQMNFEAGVAADLTKSANDSMAKVATAQAQLDAQNAQANAAGFGKAIGLAAGVAAAPFTGGASLAGEALFGGPKFGGGSALTGDAYGGSSSNPLPGLDASDYGVGY
jgi:hypothetical protein